MKTFRTHLLSELFDQPYPIQWSKYKSKIKGGLPEWMGRFQSKQNHILLTIGPPDPDDTTEVAIAFESDSSEYAYCPTFEGDEFKIFATVLAGSKVYLQDIKPQTVVFSAAKDTKSDGSREKLYTSLIRKFATSVGYMLSDIEQDFDGVLFVLTRRGKQL